MELIPKNVWFFVAFGWTVFIFWGCSTPGKDLPPVSLFQHADKLIHAVLFFGFVLFWGIWSGKVSRIWLWIVFGILYGLGLEFYQKAFVPGRSFDLWDGIADSAGAFLGAWFLRRRSPLVTG